MKHPYDPELPEELKPIEARLRAGRAQADPLRLDQIMRSVMARRSTRQGSFEFMRSRFATLFTMAALVGGTGGAIAVGASSPGASHHGAAVAQYNNGKKKCNKGFHPSHGKCVRNGNKSKAGVRGQNNARSRNKTKGTNGTSKAPTTSGSSRGFTG